MKLVYTIIKVIILLIFIVLALSNTHTVIFSYLPGQELAWPLIIILFIAFTIGAILGMVAMLGKLLRLRTENRRLHKELKEARQNITRLNHSDAQQ